MSALTKITATHRRNPIRIFVERKSFTVQILLKLVLQIRLAGA